MAKQGKLAMKGSDILQRQFVEREKARDDVKKAQDGRSARYDTISSRNSLTQHKSQWGQFAKFMEKNYPGVKTLRKIDETHVKEFVKSELQGGMAEKTLKSRVTAINHVMVGSGVWNTQQSISLKDMRVDGSISHEKGPRSVYKDLTAKEWRERNQSLYERNRGVVDVSRAFGLRRSEIYGKEGSRYNGLTYGNLGHVEGSKTLFAEVIGKGGKYRITEVRGDMRELMWERYGHSARTYSADYLKKPMAEREKMLLANGTRKNERLFGNENKKIPLHINRNEYVQEKLKERQAFWEGKKTVGKLTPEKVQGNSVGYARLSFKHNPNNGLTSVFRIDYKDGVKSVKTVSPFSVVKIGTWQGYAIAAADVMREVGHNRLDVLGKYL